MSGVIFVREDLLLKATHYKTITVPGHVHSGKWVAPFQKRVLVSDDHNDLNVAAGMGSFYQKQAHKKLSVELDHFQTMHPDEKSAIILHHATDMQVAASASAAVSGFKASMLAGKVPTTAQYLAMQNAPASVQSKVANACAATIGDDQYMKLLLAASAKANQTKGKTDESKAVEAVETSQKGQAQGASIATPAVEPAKPAEVAKPEPTTQATIAPAVVASGGALVSVSAEAKAKLDRLPWAKLMLDASNVNAGPNNKKIKAIKDAAYAGNVGQLNAMTFGSNSYAKKAALAAKAAIAALTEVGATTPFKSVPIHTFTGDGLESYVSVGTGKMAGKFSVSLKDTDAGQFVPIVNFYPTEAEAIKSAKAAAGVKDAAKAPPIPKLSDFNHILVAKQWVKMFDGGDHQGLKDSIAKLAGNMQANPGLANDPDTLGLMKYALELGHALPGGAAAPSGPKEGDTKTENGHTYKLQGGKWHRQDVVAPAAAPTAAPDDTESHKAAVAAFAGGSFYQKEALKKLKAEHGAAWDALHPSKQHEMAHAKYQALQGVASAAAAVSGWKKNMMAGQVPTPSEVKAFAEMAANDAGKAGKIMVEVQDKIGGAKFSDLVALAHAKASKSPVAQPAKVFVTTPLPVAAVPVAAPSVPAPVQQASPIPAAPAPAAPAAPVPVTSNVYINTSPGHNKFWAVSMHGSEMKTTYGKLGSQGTTTTKTFASPAAAVAAANKLKGKKVAKGYQYGYTGVHQYDSAAAAIPAKQTLAQAVADSGSLSGATAAIKDHLAQSGETAQAFDDARAVALAQGYKSLAQAIKAKKETKFPGSQIAAAPVAFSYSVKDPAFSDAPTLSFSDSGGYTFYVAFTDDGKYQTGYVDDAGAPLDHFDFVHAEDASAQLGIFLGKHGATVALPTIGEIEKLGAPVAAGPKDGDTKLGVDGGTLVFKNGRWHKQGMVIPDFNALSPDKFGPIYGSIAKTLADAVASDGLAGLKKHVTFHKNCKISVTVGPTTLKNLNADAPANFGPFKKARQDAMHKLVMDLKAESQKKPKGKKVVLTTVSPTTPAAAAPAQAAAATKPAAAAPTPKATVSAPKVKVVAGKPPITVIDGWQQTGPQKGSNPGGKFKDKAGQEWYCKFPADVDVAMNELLAAKFYQMLGVAVPNLKLVEQGGKVGIASKWVDGMSKGTAAQLGKSKGVHESFALDAWLANWDVVGLSNDNLMLGKDGAVHVDVGGSLAYRAQGGKKGADFGDTVPELETLLDSHKNPNSAAVFAGVTPGNMARGLGQLNKMKPSQIEEMCQKAGPGSDADKAALAKKLIARRAFILKKYGIDDQWAAVTTLDPTKLPVDPANMPVPFDFVNYNGVGKGLSSNDKINQQNTIDSKALFEFALKGNLTALRNYQYEAFDKATGKSLGMKPIEAHPASKIQGQWSDLCQMLTSISHPPVYGLDLPPFGGGSVDEVSDAAGYFMPGETTSTISPEKVVGFWMKLGHVGKDAVSDLVPSKISYYKSSFESKAKSWYNACSKPVKTLIHMIQGGSSGNRIWSNGIKSAAGIPLNQLAKKVYEEAVEHDEGTTIHRWMKMDQGMIDKLMSEGAGLVFQNTDSMCASIFKDWGNESHFGNGAFLKIRYAKGAKALDTYGSGSFHGAGKDAEGHHLHKGANGESGGEMEVTTLMGARFVVLDIQKGNASSSTGITMELLMLPPSDGYLAEVGKLASLGKSVVLFFTKMLKK